MTSKSPSQCTAGYYALYIYCVYIMVRWNEPYRTNNRNNLLHTTQVFCIVHFNAPYFHQPIFLARLRIYMQYIYTHTAYNWWLAYTSPRNILKVLSMGIQIFILYYHFMLVWHHVKTPLGKLACPEGNSPKLGGVSYLFSFLHFWITISADFKECLKVVQRQKDPNIKAENAKFWT